MGDSRLRVGVISSVHGVHGECKVFPTTDDIQRFKKLKKIFAIDTAARETELLVSNVKFFKNMVIVKFEGIDTPEEMQKYRGMDLFIDRTDAVPLKKGEYYIADLIGLDVIDEDGKNLGKVNDIFSTGANQIMEVSLIDGKKVLFPYIREVILKVDLDAGCIYVHVLKGLLDI